MKRAVFTLLFLTYSAIVFAQKLRIAVAANAQFVAKELETSFRKESGLEAEMVIGSSGKFTAQIKAGAPFDVFLSADTQYPDALYKSGLTLRKPKIYAYGKLVLWSEKKHMSLDKLASGLRGKIALGNPKTAPYGVAAISALKKSGVYSKISGRIVYGESIAQVTQYMLAGAVSEAFTAKSVVLEPALKSKGFWTEIDPALYAPIAQSAVVLKTTKNREAAEKFHAFLYSEKGRALFRKYGYGL
ncbi:MAG: molybdate ABC transporter substrate-binding protein [Mucilaginibacter polytrichastri]|nr:molybdate ABC transporter substrate-binding protein [Mucilaginibacter polytrichastri]